MASSLPPKESPESLVGVHLDGARPARSLLRLLGLYRWRIVGALTAFVMKDIPLWLLPLFTANVIDVVVDHRSIEQVWIWGLVACLVLLSNYPSSMIFVRISSRVFRGIAAYLRNALTDGLQRLSIGFHSRTSAAVVQSKIVRDVEVIELALAQGVPGVVSALGIIVGAVVVTALRVPTFVVVFVLAVPLAAVLIGSIHKWSQRRNEHFRREVESLSRDVGEMAALIPITRAHGLEETAKARIAASAESVRASGFSLDRLNGRFIVTSWITYQLLGVGCLIAAASASLSGFITISAGEVVLLSTYFSLLVGAVLLLFGLAPVFTKGLESVTSVAEILNETDIEENEGKPVVTRLAGRLTYRSVGFAFENSQTPALSDISLDIEAGETVAFVGASGSGKSTMLNLALGFLRPTAGTILLDDRNMHDLDLRSYRRCISVVPQESVLFSGSIKDNVAYGGDSGDENRIESALRDANAIDFVRALPDGWNTFVGERGAQLSGGQRQRIAIARAVFRDPRVLFLDEATSALDSESEASVKDALTLLMRGRTTLIVAHRLSTIQSADRVVVLDSGRIVEVGKHDDLLLTGGRYERLFRAQSF